MLTTTVFVSRANLMQRFKSRRVKARAHLVLAVITMIVASALFLCSFLSAMAAFTPVESAVEHESFASYFERAQPILDASALLNSARQVPEVAVVDEMSIPILGQEYEVPAAASNFKSYMDYRAITNRQSDAWKLQSEPASYTDEQGFRRYEGYYMVAMGTYYNDGVCGKTFRVTFESGAYLDVMIADIKSDRDTNSSGQYHLSDKSLLEFVVDTREIPEICKQMGDMSYAPELGINGAITRIQSLDMEEKNNA